MTDALRGGWSVEERAGTARMLHGPWPDPASLSGRAVALCTVLDRAVVLGSTQREPVVDAGRAAAAGIDVVRRRSGGGAVMVSPGAQVWLEAWIPRDDALWEEDVGTSSWWIGETWRRALAHLGAADLTVHRGRAVPGPWGAVVCFAGIGPGEVTTGGRKVVGVAQRRNRSGARFHSMAPLSWDPADLAVLLVDGVDGARPGRSWSELQDAALGLRSLIPAGDGDVLAGGGAPLADRVVGALLAALP